MSIRSEVVVLTPETVEPVLLAAARDCLPGVPADIVGAILHDALVTAGFSDVEALALLTEFVYGCMP